MANQHSPTKNPRDTSRQFDGIVIHGASYAKGWSRAELAGQPVINAGIGGDETRRMLERLEPDVIRVKPRAVILWGFINDIARSQGDIAVTRDQAYQNTVTMIDQVSQAGITPILATEVTITTRAGLLDRLAAVIIRLRGDESYQVFVNKNVHAVNERLRLLAAERRLTLLDFEKVLNNDDGFRKREYAAEDGSHLTEAAYVALTNYAEPILRQHFTVNTGTGRSRAK